MAGLGLRRAVRASLAVLLVLASALAGCGARGDLVENGGFEEGDGEPWHRHPTSTDWLPFELTTERVLSGQQALRTHVTSPGNGGASVIAGAMQEIELRPGRALPGSLEGSFYVSNWSSDAPRTYVQAVIMLTADPTVGGVQCDGLPNQYPCQMAFILGGIGEPPLSIGNRRFVFLREEVPPLGEWVPFSIPVAEAFAEAWGADEPPTRQLTLYLEARYETDGAPEGARVDVDVAWDEVSLA